MITDHKKESLTKRSQYQFWDMLVEIKFNLTRGEQYESESYLLPI